MAEHSTTLPNTHEPTKPFIIVILTNIIKLTPTNYIIWKSAILATLEGYDLDGYLLGTIPIPAKTLPNSTTVNPEYKTYIRQDRLIYGSLLGTLSTDVTSFVATAKTSNEVWEALRLTYGNPSRGQIKQVKERLRTMTKGTDSISIYMQNIRKATNLLASLDSPVTPEDITYYVLKGLDEPYLPIVHAINARDSSITFEELHEKLINHELSLKHNHKEAGGVMTAFNAQARSWNNSVYMKSMEENMLRVEDNLQQLQQFAKETHKFVNEQQKRHEEQQQQIENLRTETRKQFEQLTDMVCTLMAKSYSPINKTTSEINKENEILVRIGDWRGNHTSINMGVDNAASQEQADGRLSVQESRRPQKRQQANDLGQQCQYSMEKRNSVQSREGNFRFPKIDFPVFDGIKPRHWIRKSEKYFGIFAIPESQKLEIAAMYVNGKADVWLNGFLMQKPDAGWKEFSEALCARFGDKIDVEVVEEFNKLEQKGNLDEYTEQFEELKSCMLTLYSNLSESYFVSSYISGLKAEIKPLVKLGRPDSLASAFEHARLYTVAVDAIIQKSKASPPSRFQRKKGVKFSS